MKEDITPSYPELSVNDEQYFCDARPEVIEPYKGILEKFANWARSQSLWILGFGTGCGAIELRTTDDVQI